MVAAIYPELCTCLCKFIMHKFIERSALKNLNLMRLVAVGGTHDVIVRVGDLCLNVLVECTTADYVQNLYPTAYPKERKISLEGFPYKNGFVLIKELWRHLSFGATLFVVERRVAIVSARDQKAIYVVEVGGTDLIVCACRQKHRNCTRSLDRADIDP